MQDECYVLACWTLPKKVFKLDNLEATVENHSLTILMLFYFCLFDKILGIESISILLNRGYVEYVSVSVSQPDCNER